MRRVTERPIGEGNGQAAPALVSVVVVNWNGVQYLVDCLASLEQQSYSAVEIVLVDNGSTDGSPALVQTRFPSVRLIALPENAGFAAGNNAGIRAASGELIVLVNNDTRAHPDMVAAFARAMAGDPRLGAAQGKIRVMQEPRLLDNGIGSRFTNTGFLRHVGHMEPDTGDTRLRVIFAGKGACLCLRRAALEAAGPFDPAFFAYLEDTDLCWRIWLAGYTVAFVPGAELLHAGGGATTSRAGFAAINYHSFKNRIRALLKNLGAPRLAVVLPLHLLICAMLALIYAGGGQADLARAILAALRWNLRHLPDTLRRRRRVQRGVRAVSDATVFERTLAPIAPTVFLRFFRQYWVFSGQHLRSRSEPRQTLADRRPTATDRRQRLPAGGARC